jgi:hypothetical protein
MKGEGMERKLTVYAMYRGKRYNPQIRLQGRWLEAAGIKPGDKVKVEVQSEKIVIEKI